jgi:hypothetical protein
VEPSTLKGLGARFLWAGSRALSDSLSLVLLRRRRGLAIGDASQHQLTARLSREVWIASLVSTSRLKHGAADLPQPPSAKIGAKHPCSVRSVPFSRLQPLGLSNESSVSYSIQR